MADIQAFRGLRYDLGKVGSLSDVVAPPFETIDVHQQDELYRRNPYNIVRLIKNRGDSLIGDQNIYDRACEHLKNWRRDGILKKENVGSLYVYHQTFSHEGQDLTRRGFMARIRIEPYGDGKIRPLEEGRSAADESQFQLTAASKCNLGPILGLYPDQDNVAQSILEAAIDDRTPLTATEANGVKHKLWLVTDAEAIGAVANILGPKSVFTVDGQHSYESATRFRDEVRNKSKELPPDHAVDYVLMTCFSLSDPELVNLPTHWLFRGVDPLTSAELISRLGDAFDCELFGHGKELARACWEFIAVEEPETTLGLYCRADERWVLARLSSQGEEIMKEAAADRSDQWRSLGSAVLQQLVMSRLGYSGFPETLCTHGVDELVEQLEGKPIRGGDPTPNHQSAFELACLVTPPAIDQIKLIGQQGEKLPSGTTCFQPFVCAGLVINPLD